MCVGNLAQACGANEFPQQALEQFTRFSLEILQQIDANCELKETAINFFSEISKILKSQMARLIPQIVPLILEACDIEIGSQTKAKDTDDAFDLDSDESEEEIPGKLDVDGIDDQELVQQVAAVHCLGNLSLYCSEPMQPYLE